MTLNAFAFAIFEQPLLIRTKILDLRSDRRISKELVELVDVQLGRGVAHFLYDTGPVIRLVVWQKISNQRALNRELPMTQNKVRAMPSAVD